MKIAIFSDIHAEFGQMTCVDASDGDVIVLAGDCEKGEESIRFANHLREHFRVPVVMIAGNHEYYGSDYAHMLASLRKLAKDKEVHFLEKDCVVLNDVRFIGCTMWTNFCLHGREKQNEYMYLAKNRINDFHKIRFAGRKFKPADAVTLFEESYQWLEKELNRPFHGTTVVITHFAPHITAKNPRFPDDDPFRPYFVSDCSALMKSNDIDLWIYGHTHFSLDRVVENGTRLVSNQMGYPNEDVLCTGYDPVKICEI